MEAQERNFAWVARHSSLSPATVARLLRAERAMNVEQFVDMAVALNLDPSAVINQAIGSSTRLDPAAGTGAFSSVRVLGAGGHGKLAAQPDEPYRRRAAQSGESVGRAMRARQDDDAETP